MVASYMLNLRNANKALCRANLSHCRCSEWSVSLVSLVSPSGLSSMSYRFGSHEVAVLNEQQDLAEQLLSPSR